MMGPRAQAKSLTSEKLFGRNGLTKTSLTSKQCDEAQPACRNCAKSKRECLGYDPIVSPPMRQFAA